jgi:hypothetical protein
MIQICVRMKMTRIWSNLRKKHIVAVIVWIVWAYPGVTSYKKKGSKHDLTTPKGTLYEKRNGY